MCGFDFIIGSKFIVIFFLFRADHDVCNNKESQSWINDKIEPQKIQTKN